MFGQKAADAIENSEIAAAIKEELAAAKVHAEGRGIRIGVTNEEILKDIKTLIAIKLKN